MLESIIYTGRNLEEKWMLSLKLCVCVCVISVSVKYQWQSV